MNVALIPFTTPDYVHGKMPPRPRQDGLVPGPKWHLTELDAETLSGLCQQFRRDVFKKAGKVDPEPERIATESNKQSELAELRSVAEDVYNFLEDVVPNEDDGEMEATETRTYILELRSRLEGLLHKA